MGWWAHKQNKSRNLILKDRKKDLANARDGSMEVRETEALMGTVAIGSMISIVSVLFLITSAFLLGKWRKSYWRVILCLAFSDLTVSCSFVLASLLFTIFKIN